MSTSVKVAIFLGLIFLSLLFGWFAYLIHSKGKPTQQQKKPSLVQRLKLPMSFACGVLSLAALIAGFAIFIQ